MRVMIFAILAIMVAIIDFTLAVLCWREKKHTSRFLGFTMFFSAVVALSYMVSAWTKDYFTTSFTSAIYFSGIDFMLLSLLLYMLQFTRTKFDWPKKIILGVFCVYILNDFICQFINPFHEIEMHYIYNEKYGIWNYERLSLYNWHLACSYLLIAIVFFLLISKAIRSPAVYRSKYISDLIGILFVVVVNAGFILVQTPDMLDYSILFYSIIGVYMYWNHFYYSTHGMLNRVRQTVLDEMGHPVFLFDEDNYLVMYNSTPDATFSHENWEEASTLEDFLVKMQMDSDLVDSCEDIHFQWDYVTEEKQNNYRVDFRALRDRKGRIIGRMFLFTDNSLEQDILTGFHSYNSFERYYKDWSIDLEYPIAVAICDLNKLSRINRQLGEDKGDKAIQLLASLMRKHCPEDSYFARLKEADLLVISPKTDDNQMRRYIAKIREELQSTSFYGVELDMQSAISVAKDWKTGIMDATEIARTSMRSRKLMDGGSAHSSLLDSFAQTLKESDSTTEAHVQRTRDMGERLGRRLGFTDIQLSDLALLCLLHDIGKLGVPLEILNKPGKLNDAEWAVMKSHVTKGYKIAKASAELEGIADLILHHHECWNGKGYPDGLSQESIPLLSRVIAVVDTYDAMTNDRPYRKGMTSAEARKELVRCAGTQFDPSLVAEFVAMLEEEEENKADDNSTKQMTDQETIDALNANQKIRELKDVLMESVAAYAGPAETDSVRVTRQVEEQDAAQREEYLREIVYTKYLLDENSCIIKVDEQFEELTGYKESELSEYHLKQGDLIPAGERDEYWRMVSAQLDRNGEALMEHRLVRKDGTIRHVFCSGRAFFDSATRLPRSEILVADMESMLMIATVRKEERESADRRLGKWEENMRKDSLTGILNHEAFINDVEAELLKDDNQIALMILDVDDFKGFNDRYGHPAGDKILSLVARTLDSLTERDGFAGRLGGDEFAALIRLPKSPDEVEIVPNQKAENFTDQVYLSSDKEKVMDLLADENGNSVLDVESEDYQKLLAGRVEDIWTRLMEVISTQEQAATVSMGASVTNAERKSFRLLYQCADRALYDVKENGRKACKVYQD